jgi:hypothetical protein
MNKPRRKHRLKPRRTEAEKIRSLCYEAMRFHLEHRESPGVAELWALGRAIAEHSQAGRKAECRALLIRALQLTTILKKSLPPARAWPSERFVRTQPLRPFLLRSVPFFEKHYALRNVHELAIGPGRTVKPDRGRFKFGAGREEANVQVVYRQDTTPNDLIKWENFRLIINSETERVPSLEDGETQETVADERYVAYIRIASENLPTFLYQLETIGFVQDE